MKGTKKILAILALTGFVLTLAAPIWAAQLKAPDDVKTALKLLVQVSNDFKRQITNKNFARVPHEYMEYTEAADALRSGIKNEPADFKNRGQSEDYLQICHRNCESVRSCPFILGRLAQHLPWC